MRLIKGYKSVTDAKRGAGSGNRTAAGVPQERNILKNSWSFYTTLNYRVDRCEPLQPTFTKYSRSNTSAAVPDDQKGVSSTHFVGQRSPKGNLKIVGNHKTMYHPPQVNMM